MPQRQFRLIAAFAFFLVISGLFTTLFTYFNYDTPRIMEIRFLLMNFSGIQLSFLNVEWFEYWNHKNGSEVINLLNLGFYILLVIGTLLFTLSKQRETRLLRMAFSMLLFQHSLYYALNLLFTLSSTGISEKFSLSLWLISKVVHTVFIILLYKTLVIFSRAKSIRTDHVVIGEYTEDRPVEASNWQRFFHHITDTLIAILLYSSLLKMFFRNADFLEAAAVQLGPRAVIFLCFIPARIFYYFFFEWLLGATPAKLLTETRVLRKNAEKPGPGSILGRTLARFVPFEPFSFFVNNGWHDSWSGTLVAREVRSGVKGKWYLWAIPAAALVVYGINLGMGAYEDHVRTQKFKADFANEVAFLEYRIKNIGENDLLQVKNISTYSHPILKIESFRNVYSENGDSAEYALCAIVEGNFQSDNPIAAQEFYEANKETLRRVTIKKSDLLKAYNTDFEKRGDEVTGMPDLLGDGGSYEIQKCYQYLSPAIDLDDYNNYGQTSHNGDISLTLCNKGWSGTVKKITVLEGTIDWSNSVGTSFENHGSMQMSCNNFYLNGTNYKYGEPYKFEIVLVDRLNREMTFLVEGVNMDRKMTFVR